MKEEGEKMEQPGSDKDLLQLDTLQAHQQESEFEQFLEHTLQTALRLFQENADHFPQRTISSEDLGIHLTYDQLNRFLTGFGFEEDEASLETNGWQNDYWQTYRGTDFDLHIFGTMATGTFKIR